MIEALREAVAANGTTGLQGVYIVPAYDPARRSPGELVPKRVGLTPGIVAQILRREHDVDENA